MYVEKDLTNYIFKYVISHIYIHPKKIHKTENKLLIVEFNTIFFKENLIYTLIQSKRRS